MIRGLYLRIPALAKHLLEAEKIDGIDRCFAVAALKGVPNQSRAL